nr:MAG TPA: hypothetical protein [Caudoviricetes sp.]
MRIDLLQCNACNYNKKTYQLRLPSTCVSLN